MMSYRLKVEKVHNTGPNSLGEGGEHDSLYEDDIDSLTKRVLNKDCIEDLRVKDDHDFFESSQRSSNTQQMSLQ